MNQHTVQRTSCGKFAVVDPQGETLGTFCDEFLAIQTAADLDRGPVWSVPEANGTAFPRGVKQLGRWDKAA